jgi:hypothetical protein
VTTAASRRSSPSWSRGRTYARNNRVEDLHVAPGEVGGEGFGERSPDAGAVARRRTGRNPLDRLERDGEVIGAEPVLAGPVRLSVCRPSAWRAVVPAP